MGTKHLNLPLRVTVHSDDRYGIVDAAGNQVLPPQHVERTVMKTLARACNDRDALAGFVRKFLSATEGEIGNPELLLRTLRDSAKASGQAE